MAVICAIIATVIGVAAISRWRDGDTKMFAFLLACALLNAAAAIDMAADQYLYAWKLAPATSAVDPPYHRDR